MKLEDLLNFKPEDVDTLSDEQRLEICKPHWITTRPDPNKYKATVSTKSASSSPSKGKTNASIMRQAELMMQQYAHLINKPK